MFQIVCRYSKNLDSLAEIMKTYSSGIYDSVDKAKEILCLTHKNTLAKESCVQTMWGRDRKSFIAILSLGTAKGEGYQIVEYKIEAL